MKTKMVEILFRARGVFVVILIILGATASARAQAPSWTVTDTYNCWIGWNNNFCYTNGSDQWFGMTNKNGSINGLSDGVIPGLWEEFEMLAIVEDAYEYATNYYTNPNLQGYKNKINAICQGIIDQFPGQWGTLTSTDSAPNDDLLWGTVAYDRAYEITGNTAWLTQAENAFGVVWRRARVNNDAYDDGLGQTQVNGKPTNVDSAVNFNCIIAADLLASDDSS